MIQVAFDWNCIIALEEDRPAAPFLRQIQEWSRQGLVALCISRPSRMENPRSRSALVIEEEEWQEKLRGVGLGGIELREARPRSFRMPDGTNYFDIQWDQWIMKELHAKIFPKIDFLYGDYCRRCGVPPIPWNVARVDAAHHEASELQQKVARKWNNAKCDSLSLYAYSTWSEPDDLFVTTDEDDMIEKREVLHQPFCFQRKVLAPPPGYRGTFQEPVPLLEQERSYTFTDIIRGQIVTPSEAVDFLQKRSIQENHSV